MKYLLMTYGNQDKWDSFPQGGVGRGHRQA